VREAPVGADLPRLSPLFHARIVKRPTAPRMYSSRSLWSDIRTSGASARFCAASDGRALTAKRTEGATRETTSPFSSRSIPPTR
jgi:hypothetical protein